ncbi:MAG: hypothetical protein ACI3ZP_11845 [Candidatus Cryptobacteroides sp.]
MQNIWKSALKYAGVVVLLLVLAYGFVPQVLGGKIVNQSDISGYVGMAQEAIAWDREHPDDKTAWTNSMFGGMPTTMITGNTRGDLTQKIYNAFLFGKRPASYLFISLLGAFLLMLSLGVNWILAIGGAVAVTFCSYNLQIIQVGHNTKMMALAWLPWALAALIFTYKSALKKDAGWKTWLSLSTLGAALFGMAVNFQIKANHIQVTYYLAIIIFCYVIGLFIWLIIDRERRKYISRFFAASFLLLFLGLAGIGSNANKLIPAYEYSKHTMRGGSELSADEGNAKSRGLDLDYATAWSYGWEELPNLMIPNYNGGSSAGGVNPDKSHTINTLRQYGQSNLKSVAKSLPMYWGPQPFTAGPMYMGAITVFLFLLGLFMCKGMQRWWLLAATLIAVFLGVGRHFMPFTEFWYYYMPFYSKFRTVSMALVILQFTLPMLGFYALDRILKGKYTAEQFRIPGYIALALTAGFCLLLVIFPGIAGDFASASDSQMPGELVNALREDRRMLLTNDALMSMIMVLVTYFLIVWACSKPKEGDESQVRTRYVIAAVSICIVLSLNMFVIGKRYLNADHFVRPREFNGQFAQRPVDKLILEDQELGYRTVDLSVNIFNDSHPSYWHRNIGGYSPVKLQRYQDLIDRHLSGEINTLIKKINSTGTMTGLMEDFPSIPVMSMLNTKYIILGGDSAPVVNPDAMGQAWFVDNAVFATSAEEEIGLLDDIDLHNTAAFGPDSGIESIPSLPDDYDASRDSIYMTSYAPNELHYHYEAATDRLAVFSEIFYPSDWKMTIDGTEEGPEIHRANWILRSAILPAGSHDIKMRFEPRSYSLSSNISTASSALLLLLLLASAAVAYLTSRKSR